VVRSPGKSDEVFGVEVDVARSRATQLSIDELNIYKTSMGVLAALLTQ
jgi:hypothetical protein